jgi:hypothetical protein
MRHYFPLIAIIASFLTPLLSTQIAKANPWLDDRGGSIAQIFPGGNFTTTIITPRIVTETRSTSIIIHDSSYGASAVTNDRDPFNRDREDRYYHYRARHRQPTIILQQNVIYPPVFGRTCTATIIGSPIPSPVPIDSRTGQFCR